MPTRSRAGWVVAAAVALGASGCGHGRTAPPFRVLETTGEAGLRLVVIGQEQRPDELLLTVRLDNAGEQPVQVHHAPGDRLQTFALAAAGRAALGADAAAAGHGAAQAAQLQELPPGTEIELRLRWSFSPPLPSTPYPWTLTVTNLTVGDHGIADLRLRWTPPSAP